MADESSPEPRSLIWTSGFLVGMSVVQAQALGESARTDAEPSIGPIAATILQGAVFILWLALAAWFINWWFRRRWVRAWFAAAEKKS